MTIKQTQNDRTDKGGKMGIKTLKYRGKKSLQSLALPTKKIEIKEILW